MRTVWSYQGRRVDGYEQLLGCYQDREFNSPKRSTVPLLACWRNPKEPARELSETLDFRLSDEISLDFEHTVHVQRGKGKPSCTDLMLTSGDVSLGIESKWTEPRYDDVSAWLSRGSNRLNRIEVLKGWIDLLSSHTLSKPTVSAVSELPYQLVHRAASACSTNAKRRWLIYQLFDMDSKKYEMYLGDLQKLAVVLEPGRSLGICAASYNIERSERQVELESKWTGSLNRHLHEHVRDGLKDGNLLSVQLKKIEIL